MKNLTFGFILAMILLQSCNKKEIPTCENCNFTCIDSNEADVITIDCLDNWDCNFSVTPQSKVNLADDHGLTSGDKNVFQMINSTEGSPMIADDEFTNILVFELDESKNSFSLEDKDLELIQLSFKRVCFCTEVEFKKVRSGCIQGEKQTDGNWSIQGNLKVSYSNREMEVKFDSQFLQ